MKTHLMGGLVACVAMACQNVLPATASACAPAGYDREALLRLRDKGFGIDEAERERFARELVDCLASPDPVLRDDIGYGGLSVLLREGGLAPETVRWLRAALVRRLDAARPDPHGVARPFAVLALSEVARVDRIQPLFTADAREELVALAVQTMNGVEDYRGFDERDGWRHSVAHTADLILQLTLNDAVTRAQRARMRAAIAGQVAPRAGHFYIYGESERLARPILYMALRGEFSEEDWTAWFEALADPAPLASWDEAFASQAGLARRHNLYAFATSVYVNADVGDNENLRALLPGCLALLRAIP